MRRILVIAAAAAALGGCTSMGEAPWARAPNRCTDFTTSIYFEDGSADLTPQARRLVNTMARHARGCTVNRIDVVGLASATGDSAINQALSQRRVATVTRALADRGYRSVEFAAAAAGDAGAQTRSGELRPLRRRVDITMHLAARAGAR
jgi:outer membrane protein OmpA-like peptidoglycan-associated protein